MPPWLINQTLHAYSGTSHGQSESWLKRPQDSLFFRGRGRLVEPIPLARYQRIYDRARPIMLYAGKSLRFIETVVERDHDGKEELVNAYFLRHQYEEHGL